MSAKPPFPPLPPRAGPRTPRQQAAHRRRVQRLARTVGIALVLLVAILLVLPKLLGGGPTVVATSPSAPAASAGPSSSPSPAPFPSPPPPTLGPPPKLAVATLPTGLPAPLSREQVQPHGKDLWILGGLSGTLTTAAVESFHPVSGTVTSVGSLAAATHDAASAVSGSGVLLFGGGGADPIATVQSFTGKRSATLGQLPEARSDLDAATVDGTTYLLGGYDGSASLPTILSTTDGRTFKVVTELPTPVRYAGIAVVGTTIYVIGGLANGVPTALIQAVNTLSGTAAVIAHLPVALSDESAFVLGGGLFVVGGKQGSLTRNQVDSLNPTTGVLTRAAVLPAPVADAGLGQIGNDVYLFGGEAPAQLSSIVHISIAPG